MPTFLNGSNTYTGATTVDSGATLSGADGADVFSATSATTVNGTLDLGGNDQTVSSLAGAGVVTNSGASGTATLTDQGASSTFGGVIQDGATAATALTLNAPGATLTLTGANTYSGATTITAGTLALSGSGGVANSSGVYLAAGSIFDISQTTAGASVGTLGNTAAGQTGTVYLGAQTLTLTGALTTFGGVIADAGGINNVSGGGLTLGPTATGVETLTGVNTYTGATTINAGTLALAGGGSIANSSGDLGNGRRFRHFRRTGGASIATSGTPHMARRRRPWRKNLDPHRRQERSAASSCHAGQRRADLDRDRHGEALRRQHLYRTDDDRWRHAPRITHTGALARPGHELVGFQQLRRGRRAADEQSHRDGDERRRSGGGRRKQQHVRKPGGGGPPGGQNKQRDSKPPGGRKKGGNRNGRPAYSR